MTIVQPRVPAGVRDGGQFATAAHPEPALTLAAPDAAGSPLSEAQRERLDALVREVAADHNFAIDIDPVLAHDAETHHGVTNELAERAIADGEQFGFLRSMGVTPARARELAELDVD